MRSGNVYLLLVLKHVFYSSCQSNYFLGMQKVIILVGHGNLGELSTGLRKGTSEV